MPGQKRSPKKPRIPNGIIIAILSFTGVVITAFCTSSSSIGGKIIEVLTNPDRAVISQKNQVPESTLAPTTMPASPFSNSTATMQSISISTDKPTAECADVEIYFKLNLSTGVDQIKCPDQHNVVNLEFIEVQELSVLSGKAVALAFSNDTICHWRWRTNENINTQELSSPKGDCSFSITLTKTVSKIYLQLISNSAQPFFSFNLQR